ncbi:hypothetical protein HDU93_003848 [Gonapodya sp. JEL0774]|nr:hypothetical protein HDU93_003848 [Gonapodya sp. JEL0774]
MAAITPVAPILTFPRDVKELKSPLVDFDPKDPIGSLTRYNSFIDNVKNHIKLKDIRESNQRIAAIAHNIPPNVRNRMPTATLGDDPDWNEYLKALDGAYFPRNTSMWNHALEQMTWDPTQRFSNHVMEFKTIAHRAGVINLNDISTLDNQLRNQQLWYYFQKALPSSLQMYLSISGIKTLADLTDEHISSIEENPHLSPSPFVLPPPNRPAPTPVSAVQASDPITTLTQSLDERFGKIEKTFENVHVAIAALQTSAAQSPGTPPRYAQQQRIQTPPAPLRSPNANLNNPPFAFGCGWCGNTAHTIEQHLDNRYLPGGARYGTHFLSHARPNNRDSAPPPAQNYRRNNGNAPRQDNANANNGNFKCYTCQQPGHISRNCPYQTQIVALATQLQNMQTQNVRAALPAPANHANGANNGTAGNA